MQIANKKISEFLQSVLNTLDDGIVIYGKRRIDMIINDSARHFLSSYNIEIDYKKIKIYQRIKVGSDFTIFSNLNKIREFFNEYPPGEKILNIINATDSMGNKISLHRKTIGKVENNTVFNLILIKHNLTEIEQTKTIVSMLNLIGEDLMFFNKEKEDGSTNITIKLIK